MKKLTVLFMLFISLSFTYSQEYYTDGDPNGIFWNQLDRNEKENYVNAFLDGQWISIDVMWSNVRLKVKDHCKYFMTFIPETLEEMLANTKEAYLIDRSRIGEVIEYADRLTEKPENRKVPLFQVFDVILVVKLYSQNTDDELFDIFQDYVQYYE